MPGEGLTEGLFNELGELLRSDDPSMACATSDYPIPKSLSMRSLTAIVDRVASSSQSKTIASIDRLMNQLHNLSQTTPCPIVAVTGLLNAGKSSLLAGFLSPEGRRRILIGSANSEGTHRFVLWLPESWRQNPSVWNVVIHQLVSVFGFAPEMLSHETAIAVRQYNGERMQSSPSRESGSEQVESKWDWSGDQPTTYGSGDQPTTRSASPMLIPLLATDPALDQWGIGLMDCPDIQTGVIRDAAQRAGETLTDALGQNERQSPSNVGPRQLSYSERVESIADHRAIMLARAIRVCSAFLIVVPSNALQERKASVLLETLQREMPGVGRILAINRVQRRYTTSEIAAEALQSYSSFGLERVYMAYNFDGPVQRERLPKAPIKVHRGPDSEIPSYGLEQDSVSEIPANSLQLDDDQHLPIFFQISPPPTPQPPAEVPLDRYLVSLGAQMDRGRLVQDCRRSLASQLNQQLRNVQQAIHELARRRRTRIARLQQTLANACLEFSATRSPQGQVIGVRLQASKEIVKQLADSLERTAPWWAFPGRIVDRTMRATKDLLAKSTSAIIPLGWLSGKSQQAVEFVRGKIHSGEIGKVVSAKALEDELRRCDIHGDLMESDFEEGQESHSDRLLVHCQQMIDRFQLESQTRLNEEEVDRYTAELWKNMSWKRRLWTGIAPATLLFAPLVAVIMLPFDFGGSSVLIFASMKELLVAAGIGAAVAALQPGQMPKVAEDEAAWQQLSDLFAIGCDSLALPRPPGPEQPALQLTRDTKRLRPSPLPVKVLSTDVSSLKEVVPILANQPIDINLQFEKRLDQLLENLLESAS